jgi:universal stress protein A
MRPQLRYGKVLAPIDFSDRSRELLRYAAAFAREHGSRLILMHSVEPVIYSADLGTFATPFQTMSTELKKAAQDKLAEWSREEVGEGLSVKTIVVVGAAFQQITDAAAREKADLIILSTHGFTGLKHILMGSTAERVVRHAKCPVLTLPRKSPPPEEETRSRGHVRTQSRGKARKHPALPKAKGTLPKP